MNRRLKGFARSWLLPFFDPRRRQKLLANKYKSHQPKSLYPGTRVRADIAAGNDDNNRKQCRVLDGIVDRQTNDNDGEDNHTQPVPSATGSVVAHCSHGSCPAPRQIALA